MSEIDVVDEAVIDADPAAVVKAIADEAMGKTHWWLPHLESKPRGDIPASQVGGMSDITLHGSRGTARFTAKTVEITENTLRLEYVEGSFRGEGLWTLEPVDGKTRLRFRWRVEPCGWVLRFVGLFINIAQGHHKVMKDGFAGLNEYLKRPTG